MKEKGIIVGVFLKDIKEKQMHRKMSELEDLSRTLSIDVKEQVIQRADNISPATYIGSGKIKEIKEIVDKLKIEIAVFSVELSPVQLRNLEKMLEIKVIDRNELILSIFAKNAHTNISMVEVEIAQYKYMMPRLAGKGIMLSRLGGGIGTRGPGETKLETDRRHIEDKIDYLGKKLKQYKKNQELRFGNRGLLFNATLIGYTNAGKTALMNTIVKGKFYSDDKLFTTLDTVTRKMDKSILLTDTVGFLGDLPHELIKSFELTIEEARRADLKIVVVDISDEYVHDRVMDMNNILEELELNSGSIIYVFNKTDLLVEKSVIEYFKNNYPEGIFVSAKSGENIPILKKSIMDHFKKGLVFMNENINPASSDLINFIEGNGYIDEKKADGSMINYKFYLSSRNANIFAKMKKPEIKC